jgi:hypothetical protein
MECWFYFRRYTNVSPVYSTIEDSYWKRSLNRFTVLVVNGLDSLCGLQTECNSKVTLKGGAFAPMGFINDWAWCMAELYALAMLPMYG